jgi:hypothetical protein
MLTKRMLQWLLEKRATPFELLHDLYTFIRDRMYDDNIPGAGVTWAFIYDQLA